MAKRKPRERKPDPIQFKAPAINPGCPTQWDSLCGMFRKRHVDQIGGVCVPSRWQGWQWTHGMWRKIHECRSERAVDEILAKKYAELENSDDE